MPKVSASLVTSKATVMGLRSPRLLFSFPVVCRSLDGLRWRGGRVRAHRFEQIDTAPSGQGDKNYLFDALIAGIHANPLQWHLVITVGQPGDPTADATLPWPPDRQQVDAGTLTIDHVESEDTSPTPDINFDPPVLPTAISPSAT